MVKTEGQLQTTSVSDIWVLRGMPPNEREGASHLSSSTAKGHVSRKTKTSTVGPEFGKTQVNCEKDEDDSKTASLEPNP